MALKIIGGILICLVAIILIYYFCEGRCDLKFARKDFPIYGLKEGFVPQGICYSKWLDCFLVSGYMSNKKYASRIYVIEKQSGKLIKFITLCEKNKNLFGHFGGITCFGDNIWVSSDGEVLRISQSSIKNAKNTEKIEIIDKFCSKNGADFCFAHEGILWIGEFYKLGKFKTDISHHIKLDDSNNFHALCYGYKILGSGKFGISKPVPEKALAVPDLCQGLCIYENKIFTSTSYGIQKSNLTVFENVLKSETDRFTYFENKKIPLYFMKQENIQKKYTLPAMSEGIAIEEGRLFILFENNAKKYRFFTRKKVKNIFSFPMNKF